MNNVNETENLLNGTVTIMKVWLNKEQFDTLKYFTNIKDDYYVTTPEVAMIYLGNWLDKKDIANIYRKKPKYIRFVTQ